MSLWTKTARCFCLQSKTNQLPIDFCGGLAEGVIRQQQRRNSRAADYASLIRPTRWEHTIRDDVDSERHIDYIHYNPVKHGLMTRVAGWPYSSFHRYVAQGILPGDWAGDVSELSGRFGE
jgi:putative transposase